MPPKSGGENIDMAIRWLTLFFDTPRGKAEKAEAFWLRVTHSELSARRSEFATLIPHNGDPYLRMQEIGSDSPGCHLDVHADDVQQEAQRAVRLGASVVDNRATLVWLRSPGGLNTCIVRHHGESAVPQPVTWAGGQRSIVDQLCIDAPPALYEHEIRFWAAFTGWERRAGSTPEFEHLARQPEMPLRLLFQRLDDPADRVRAHADLACDGVAAETERHRDLGAVLVRKTEQWTTLRDPADRDYCITGRIP
jgi:hypothetical protein